MSIYKHPDSYSGFSFALDEMIQYKYAWGCSYRGQDDIARCKKFDSSDSPDIKIPEAYKEIIAMCDVWSGVGVDFGQFGDEGLP